MLLGVGDGTFSAPNIYPPGTGGWAVVSGDFDGDDLPDLATTIFPAGVSVLLNLCSCDNAVVVTPTSIKTTRGTFFSGGISEISKSDDKDYRVSRSSTDVQSRTEFVVKATSPVLAPRSLEFTLEGSVFSRIDVVQTIELYDYAAQAWDQVDTRIAARFPSSDVVVSATRSGDTSRFVDQTTQCIAARIRFKSNSSRRRFTSNTDKAIWTIK